MYWVHERFGWLNDVAAQRATRTGEGYNDSHFACALCLVPCVLRSIRGLSYCRYCYSFVNVYSRYALNNHLHVQSAAIRNNAAHVSEQVYTYVVRAWR